METALRRAPVSVASILPEFYRSAERWGVRGDPEKSSVKHKLPQQMPLIPFWSTCGDMARGVDAENKATFIGFASRVCRISSRTIKLRHSRRGEISNLDEELKGRL